MKALLITFLSDNVKNDFLAINSVMMPSPKAKTTLLSFTLTNTADKIAVIAISPPALFFNLEESDILESKNS